MQFLISRWPHCFRELELCGLAPETEEERTPHRSKAPHRGVRPWPPLGIVTVFDSLRKSPFGTVADLNSLRKNPFGIVTDLDSLGKNPFGIVTDLESLGKNPFGLVTYFDSLGRCSLS